MVQLLTSEEREQLPQVLERRTKFKKLLGMSIINYDKIFSNCMMIQGKPGTGKTTLVTEYVGLMEDAGAIAGYRRAAGHVTPTSLYTLLEQTATPVDGKPMVLILDDIDCLADQGCLELMKAAFDTKSNAATNRNVCYMTKNATDFKYNGYCVIITNDSFTPDKASIHQQALLDRVQQVTIDFKKEDAAIYSTHLVEEYLNKNEDSLTDDQIKAAEALFNNEIRRWMNTNAFKAAGINFSIRLIKKFIDAEKVFGDAWKDYNTSYIQLNAAAEVFEAKQNCVETDNEHILKNETGIIPLKDENGNYINPRTGMPYSSVRNNHYKKLENSKIA